ncbi:kinase [Thraustotheca clavata]|uniref:Kinase n=1 Tax=Thraustotheca clavata TaxID=74557 RepID=A0A1V9ZVC9_9STRA|nr:kinase [Thraustotheca clavata]
MSNWLESADYVARFHELDAHNVRANASTTALPPSTVTARLEALDLVWDELPELLRRGLLWDMGLVLANISGTDTYVQVYTKCKSSMASIGLTMAEFRQTNPISQNVTECRAFSTNSTVLRQYTADGNLLDSVVKCAIDLQDIPDPQSSLLAQDDLGPKDVPQPRVWRHRDAGAGWTKLAIHTLPSANYPEAAWSTCPKRKSARIIPCEVRNQRLSSNNTCIPKQSDTMTQWLTSYKATLPAKSRNGLSTANIILISCICGAALVAIVGYFVYRRYRYRPSTTDSSQDLNISPKYRGERGTDPTHHDYVRAQTPPSPGYQSYELSASTVEIALQELYRDPSIKSKQLVYTEIDWVRILAAGAYGEVYLGQYRKRNIAIKRIQAMRTEMEGVVEAFAEEIRLMAHFRHPNIVSFIGFAWDLVNPTSLCAVTEYLVEGDLKAYLLANPTLPWSTKMVFALDVARALQYLHELLEQTIIHRDLKSKNILLALPHAKLSDFGISREQINDDTLTAGVGTAFYSAPEVMKGLKYTKQADIYSFGCVLAEMDTHKNLYHEWRYPAIAILNKVMHEGLRPSMSPTCPKAIYNMAQQCFDADPAMRPTASDIARDLSDLVSKGRIERHAWKSSESLDA